MASMIYLWAGAHRYRTSGTCSCGGGGVVVWTKTAAVEREGAIGCTGRGRASISKQDFSEKVIIAFLLFPELLVSEAGLLVAPGSAQFLHAFLCCIEGPI